MGEKYDKLRGTHVLIFGGSSGVGFAVAEASLAANASRVTIIGSSARTANSAADKLRSAFPDTTAKIQALACDLFSEAELESRLEAVFKEATSSNAAPIDHLVYTAGDVHHPKPLAEISYQHILDSGRVRCFAALLVAKICVPYLSPGPAASLTFSNGYVATRPVARWVPETAYAGALESAVRCLALEMRPVRVNLVSLGVVDTALLESSFGSWRDWIVKDQTERNLCGELGRAEDVAETYLGCMRNRNMTGSVVVSDAGVRFV